MPRRSENGRGGRVSQADWPHSLASRLHRWLILVGKAGQLARPRKGSQASPVPVPHGRPRAGRPPAREDRARGAIRGPRLAFPISRKAAAAILPARADVLSQLAHAVFHRHEVQASPSRGAVREEVLGRPPAERKEQSGVDSLAEDRDATFVRRRTGAGPAPTPAAAPAAIMACARPASPRCGTSFCAGPCQMAARGRTLPRRRSRVAPRPSRRGPPP